MCGSCPSRNELSVSGYEDLYRCLSKTDRRPYLEVSLAELSGLINYSLQHRQAASYRPGSCLAEEEKRSWVPSDAVDFLRSCAEPSWMDVLPQYGWRDVVGDCTENAPQPSETQLAILRLLGLLQSGSACDAGVPAGSSELEQPKAAIKRELSLDRPPAPRAKRLLSMAELEQHLLKGYRNRAFTSDLSDLGQVLHGLVAACQRQLRDWGEHVGILQAGSEQHDGSLSLQMHASTLLCILHSPQHWSLLVLHRPRRGRTEACIYDGRVDKVCQDSAHAFLVSLQGRGWMPEESLSPVTATCSKQTDSWSSGHRLVLTADMVLEHVCKHDSLPRHLDGPTDADIHSLVAGVAARREPAAGRSVPSTKRPRVGPSQQGVQQTPLTGHGEEEQTPAPSGHGEEEPRTPVRSKKRTAEHLDRSGSSCLTPPVSRYVARAPRRKDAKDAQARSASKPVKLTKAALKDQRREAIAAVEAVGITHTTFQRRHVEEGTPALKDHWHIFLEGVSDPTKVVVCSTCEPLLQKIHEPKPRAAQLVPVTAAEPAAAPVQAAQVHKPGRPKKGEQRWSLAVFMKNNRSDVYEQTLESLGKSAAWKCRACNVVIKFGTQTCKAKVDSHEACPRHQKGLRRLGLITNKEGVTADQGAAAPSAPVPDASEAPRPCAGVSSTEPSLPLHSLHTSALLYMEMGQPHTIYSEHEADPFKPAIFKLENYGVSVRSQTCEGSAGRGGLACRSCANLCKSKSFRECLAAKAYLIDTVTYTWKKFYATPVQQEEFKQELLQRDYVQQGLAGKDLQHVLTLSSMDLAKKLACKVNCMPSWRVSGSLNRFLKHWMVQPQVYNSGEAEALAHTALCGQVAGAIANGSVRQTDIQLGAKVASGALRADALVEGLTTSFLMGLKAKLGKRQTSSQYCDYTVLAESLVTLGKNEEVQNLLKTFKVNPRPLQRLRLDPNRSPQAFTALSIPGQVQKCFKYASTHLQAAGHRLHLMIDETTWSSSWEQIAAICSRSHPEAMDIAWILGVFDADGDKDLSVLSPLQWQERKPSKKDLARLGLHAVVQRCDDNRWQFDLCAMPVGRGTSSDTVLELAARILQEMTDANAGLCPTGCAYDGGSANGQTPPEVMKNLPFFSSCKVVTPELKFWPYGYLSHGGHALVSFNGAFHWLKRFSLQFLSGCRKVCLGALWVDISVELEAGLPEHVYTAVDPQSDKAAAMLLSPPFVGSGWMSLGTHLMSLLAGLFVTCTTGSIGYSKTEMALNSCSALYLLVLITMGNQQRFKQHWRQHSLADVTVRNGCALAHFSAMSCMSTYEPKFLQEIGIERHFGHLKAPFRGSPSFKDYLYGNLAWNCKQTKRLSKLQPEDFLEMNSTRARDALSMDEMKTASKQACASAVQLYSWISEDQAPCDVYDSLRTWWPRHATTFFHSIHEDNDEDLDPDIQEILDSGLVEAQRTADADLLHAVEDRAKIQEEILGELADSESKDAGGPTDHNEQETELHDATGEASAKQTSRQLETSEPQNAAARTLPSLLQQCVDLSPAFQTDQLEGQGRAALLKRVAKMAGPIEAFVKQARLEEKLLSPRMLGVASKPLTAWNQCQHELAMANRAAGARLARAQQWQAVQRGLVDETMAANPKRTADDKGFEVVAEYRPHRDDSNSQVIAFLPAGTEDNRELAVGLVLSCFRGSIVRKQGDSEGKVRTSKAFPMLLPATATKLLHVALLVFCPEHNEYITSCAEVSFALDPCRVYGQLSVQTEKASPTRLHLRLTEAATGALAVLRSIKLPSSPPEPGSTAPVSAASSVPEAAPAVLEFTDRSFYKAAMPSNVEAFFRGLIKDFAAKGTPLVDDGGMISLERGHKEKWDNLVRRIPAIFFIDFQNLQGYRFSQAVHNQCMRCLPEKGSSD